MSLVSNLIYQFDSLCSRTCFISHVCISSHLPLKVMSSSVANSAEVAPATCTLTSWPSRTRLCSNDLDPINFSPDVLCVYTSIQPWSHVPNKKVRNKIVMGTPVIVSLHGHRGNHFYKGPVCRNCQRNSTLTKLIYICLKNVFITPPPSYQMFKKRYYLQFEYKHTVDINISSHLSRWHMI